MKKGVLYEITTIVPRTPNAHRNHISMLRGMSVSIVSTSLLKRLTMRPMGVVSKNAICAWSVDCSSSRCSMAVARAPPNTSTNVPMYVHTATSNHHVCHENTMYPCDLVKQFLFICLLLNRMSGWCQFLQILPVLIVARKKKLH